MILILITRYINFDDTLNIFPVKRKSGKFEGEWNRKEFVENNK